MGTACGGAAGVALASATVEAGIITSGAVNQTVNTGATPFDVDIDNDSTVEFRFTATIGGKGTQFTEVSGQEAGSEFVIDAPFPDRLSLNTLVDSSTSTANVFGTLTASSTGADWGAFGATFPNTGYLGVKFDLASSTHFGWIEITSNSHTEIVINQWAYEDVANTGILAGDTGPASVPEPGSAALMGVVMAAAVIKQRFRRWSTGGSASDAQNE